MENNYIFSDQYLGISDKGIHFLRNRFEYKSFSYSEINAVTFTKGKAIKNWIILLIIGCGLSIWGVLSSIKIISFLVSEKGGSIYIEEIAIALFLIFFGFFFLYQSLRKEKILIINGRNSKNKFSTKTFEKKGELNDMINFLSKKCNLDRDI